MTYPDVSTPPEPEQAPVGVALLSLALLLGMVLLNVTADPRAIAQEPNESFLSPVSVWGGEVSSVAVSGNVAYAGVGAQVVAFDATRPESLQELGRTGVLAGVVHDIAVNDVIVYAACDLGGTLVIDMGDLRTPRELGRIEAQMGARVITHADGKVYVGDGTDLVVVDVSSTSAPMELGRVAVRGSVSHFRVTGVAVDGATAYTIDSGGPGVVDVSDPSRPVVVDTIWGQGNWDPTDILLLEGYAWIATGSSGIRVIDLSVPGRPRQTAVVALPGRRLAASGNLVLVATDGGSIGEPSRLLALDPADPRYPEIVGEAPIAGRPSDLVVADGRAWLGLANRGLEVLTVQDPADMERVSLKTSRSVWSVSVDGGRAVVIENAVGDDLRELVELDVTDPSEPVPVGSTTVPTETVDVALDNDIAVLAGGSSGLHVVDMASPSGPRIAGTLAAHEQAAAVALDEGVAYVLDGPRLRVVDVSDLNDPRQIGALSTRSREAAGLTILGDFAYIATDTGVAVADIFDPALPRWVRFVYPKGGYPGEGALRTFGVDAKSDHLYVAVGKSGLSILDASDPSAPREVNGFLVPNGVANEWDPKLRLVRGVAASGNQLYALTSPMVGVNNTAGLGTSSLLAFDVTDPTQSAPFGWQWRIGDAAALAVDSQQVYLADGAAGLMVLEPRTDVTPTPSSDPRPSATPQSTDTPTTPPQVAFLPLVSRTAKPASQPVDLVPVTQSGGLAVAAAATDEHMLVGVGPRLLVFDVNDASAPRVVGQTEPLGVNVFRVAVDGDRAYVLGSRAVVDDRHYLDAWDETAMVIVDIADPTAPVRLGTLEVGTSVHDVAAAGDRAYLLVGEWSSSYDFRDPGLMIVDASDPHAPVQTKYDTSYGYAGRLLVRSSLLYLVAGSSALQVVDVSISDEPRLLGSVDRESITCWSTTAHVALAGDTLWMTCSESLVAFDVADPDQPRLDADFPLEELLSEVPGWTCCASHALTAAPGRLHLLELDSPASPRAALVELDVSDRGAPQVSGSLWLDDFYEPYIWAPALAGIGERLVLTTGDTGGVRVVDISNTGHPAQSAARRGVGKTREIVTDDEYLYAADPTIGLQVIRITAPDVPLLRGALPDAVGIWRLAAAGEHVFALSGQNANSLEELIAIDVSDADNPRLTGSVDIEGRPLNLAVADDHVYLASGERGLEIVDAANPSAMSSASVFGSRHKTSSVAVRDGLAYVADGLDGIAVVDVTDPYKPREMGHTSPAGYGPAVGIELASGRLGAAFGWDESHTDFLAFDVESPTSPIASGSLRISNYGHAALSMAGSGRHVHTLLAGILAVDVYEPTGPVIAGSLDVAASDIAADGDVVYAAAGQGGLYVYRVVPR